MLVSRAEVYQALPKLEEILVKKFSKNRGVEPNQEYPPEYVLWLKHAQSETVTSLISDCQVSLDVMFHWKSLLHAISRFFEEYKEALGNGTKVRLITDTVGNAEAQEIIQPLKAFGSIEIRQTSELSGAGLAIFDKKIVDLITSQLSFSSSACLRSGDKDFVSMMIDYFELKWRGAANQIGSHVAEPSSSTGTIVRRRLPHSRAVRQLKPTRN
jgi:hypothetical protein